MKKIFLVFLYIIFTQTLSAQVKSIGVKSASNMATLSGRITDENGNPLFGAVVQIISEKKGAVTNADGDFSFVVSVGSYNLSVNMIGFKTEIIKINLLGSGTLKVKLLPELVELDEVIISNRKPEENVSSTDMGKNTLTIEALSSMPAFAGEVDVIRSITLLPGVSTAGEASSGFNVRGGGASQNLILLGGATLYNPSHLFGFFTAFNSDLVQNATLYKGGIPAKYGGRSSSILDIKYRNDGARKWQGKATVGLISAKLLLEGPIIKDRLSVILGGRASYSDWMLGAVRDPDISNSSASFYDLNAIVNYRPNDKNRFSYSFYNSGDDFGFASDTILYWTNSNQVLEWSYNPSDKYLFTLTLIDDNYKYAIQSNDPLNSFELISSIKANTIKLNADVKLFKENTINFGVESSLKTIQPGELRPLDEQSFVNNVAVENEKAIESAAFLEINLEPIKSIGISAGLRYNRYSYLGENNIYFYEPLIPKTETTIIDSVRYDNLKPIYSNSGIEPRLSLRWSISTSASVKGGYNRMYQYLQLISNTTTIAPTDVWKLSDQYVEPSIVDQYSLGFFKNLNNNSYETSLEVYYKDIQNVVEYKDGAELLLNPHIETELLSGIGMAYGIEAYIKKNSGKMTGWLSYTYSRSLSKVAGAYRETTINNGNWFASNFDKPHDFTMVFMYAFNPQWSISSTFTFSTGRPVTYPSAKFNYEGEVYAYFNERNSFRVPNYHRLDFSATYKAISKYKILNGEWVFSVYNMYGRKNAFSVFFDDVVGAPPQAYQLSVLGIPFPSLSYSFKF